MEYLDKCYFYAMPLYKHLITHHLITKNESGFWPDDSTTNQLIDLVDEIHQAFDSKKPLEFCAVFLDILKVWQNGISCNLLKLFQNYLSNRKQRIDSVSLKAQSLVP